ncbi:acyl-CoA dehydrogenase family protein [Cupriavidus pinatubonensis]|uniref:acyl-CoA dehydrogenase family protein n=1 Tax=Cupriavidus pinatubonensis TaxID=248026 RepID=UPI001126A9E8|nr:acyl-CoA dehydrogenase family protein [Cupriavidus pinatubonensis]TPQ33971.1 acyl-CoA dehydrogenase [Cupriavidus pinatubonensis]
MGYEYSEKVEDLRKRTHNFMERYVLPANSDWLRAEADGRFPLDVVEPCKLLAREEGLWNLFLPALREDEPGTRLSNLEYAPLAEIMGRIPWASEVFNCNAPDTGNMELLHRFATPMQYERWLRPLLEGQIRSCFAMTEPDVASSDATNIQTRICVDGDHLVINGRKWFTTGALHPNCRFAIVMGISDEMAQPQSRHSMVIVPLDTPGVRVVRNVPIMHHYAVDGHCEILFREARVPKENLIGEMGKGFAMAQARLGPGRIHHCMRTIGQCELALELMCERAIERKAFGKNLAEYSNIQDWIAHSRIEIDQARLFVLRAAALIDRRGNEAARVDVSAIKVIAGQLQTRVVDRAMQVFGAMGLTSDTPLAFLWSWGRALRFIDGPDEVHLRVVAKHEIKKSKETLGKAARYLHVSQRI